MCVCVCVCVCRVMGFLGLFEHFPHSLSYFNYNHNSKISVTNQYIFPNNFVTKKRTPPSSNTNFVSVGCHLPLTGEDYLQLNPPLLRGGGIGVPANACICGERGATAEHSHANCKLVCNSGSEASCDEAEGFAFKNLC